MKDNAQRLMNLLRGHCEDRPPLWDPWFAMTRFLGEQYDGDYLAMAEDLGHAAVPVGLVRTTVDCFDRDCLHSSGRGPMRHARQHPDEPDPYWELQRDQAIAGREACHEAGLACWMTIKWSFDAAVGAMGYEEFATECYDDPNRVARVIDCVEHRNRLAVEHLVAAAKPDFVLFEANCAYQSGPMIAPALMRELTEDTTKQTVTMLGDLNIPAVFHTEGKVDGLVDRVIDMGFAALHGCDPQANDLGQLVEQFGDRITLCGNMDVALLATGTPAEVTRATRKMLKVGSAKGRFIAGANSVIQDDTPPENYLAMTKAITKGS